MRGRRAGVFERGDPNGVGRAASRSDFRSPLRPNPDSYFSYLQSIGIIAAFGIALAILAFIISLRACSSSSACTTICCRKPKAEAFDPDERMAQQERAAHQGHLPVSHPPGICHHQLCRDPHAPSRRQRRMDQHSEGRCGCAGWNRRARQKCAGHRDHVRIASHRPGRRQHD